jgi:dTDP-4-amino-4,6-dideoxygalactose transaminase
VDFVDIDPATLNLSVAALKEKLDFAEKSGKLPKAVIAVDFAGEPCDMRAIKALTDRHCGIKLIEDASHAIGARYAKKPVGASLFCDITIFSFHPVKLITTGEGGMALTNDAALAEKLTLFRSHGITRQPTSLTCDEGPWYYEQQVLGYNYRMTEMQAALGTSQLKRLDDWVTRRHQLADQYDLVLRELPLKLPLRDATGTSALHLYPVQLTDARHPRRKVFEQLRADGIGVNVHYIPVHLQPDYRSLGFKEGDFPASEAYYQRAISLPIYADLSDEAQQRVVQSLSYAVQS